MTFLFKNASGFDNSEYPKLYKAFGRGTCDVNLDWCERGHRARGTFSDVTPSVNSKLAVVSYRLAMIISVMSGVISALTSVRSIFNLN